MKTSLLISRGGLFQNDNQDAFPMAINLYNQELMTGRGRGKYTYKKLIREEAEVYVREIMKKYFPNNKILYIS